MKGGGSTNAYTTFIMANSDFCIVAESMDEMIALTLTACQN